MNVEDLTRKGIPADVVPLLRARGIETLTEVQAQAVAAGALDGSNLVVSAPTSAGKTLIGELLAVKHAGKGCTVFLVSHKALARQVRDLFDQRYIVDGTPYLRAGVLTGDEDGVQGEWGHFDVVVSTYEKFYATAIVGSKHAKGVSCVVVDEVQLVGEQNRGAALELLLAALRTGPARGAQLVALSATVPNGEALADWLGAKLVRVSTRTPPLEQELWLPGARLVYSPGAEEPTRLPLRVDASDVGAVVADLLKTGRGQVAVMATTKPRVEEYASAVASKLPLAKEMPAQLIREFRSAGDALDALSWMQDALSRGIGIHHANLSPEQRALVEDAFRDGVLKVIVATPTLVAGVNMPIRTVVYPSMLRFNGITDAPISIGEYTNGSGRAGRLGMHDRGTAIIMATSLAAARQLSQYIVHEPEVVKSQLDEHTEVYRLVHLLTATHTATLDRLVELASATLWGSERGLAHDDVQQDLLRDTMRREVTDPKWAFLWRARDDEVEILPAGRAVATSGLDPAEALEAYTLVNALAEDGSATRNELLKLICTIVGLAGMDGFLPSMTRLRRHWAIELRERLDGYVSDTAPDAEVLAAGIAGVVIGLLEVSTETENEMLLDRAQRERTCGQASRLLAVGCAMADAAAGWRVRSVTGILEQVADGLSYLVPMEAAGLATLFARRRVRGVGTGRIVRLAALVQGDPARVLKLEDEQLAKAVGSSQVAAVRDAILRDMKRLFSQQAERQLAEASADAGIRKLVDRILREGGTDFESPVGDALKLLGWDVQRLDPAGSEAKPDLAGTSRSGRPVMVECKASADGISAVRRGDVFDILDKVAPENPALRLVVVRPQAEYSAVERVLVPEASQAAIHIITASALIECVLATALRGASAALVTSLLESCAVVGVQEVCSAWANGHLGNPEAVQ